MNNNSRSDIKLEENNEDATPNFKGEGDQRYFSQNQDSFRDQKSPQKPVAGFGDRPFNRENYQLWKKEMGISEEEESSQDNDEKSLN